MLRRGTVTMAHYYRLESLMNLAEGYRKAFKIDSREILLVQPNKQAYLIENACPHLGIQLQNAKFKGESIVCPGHQFEFDLRTGRNRLEHLTRCRPLKFFDLVTRGNEVGVYL